MDGSEESEEHAHVLLQAKGSARDVVMSRWEWEEFGGPAASDMLWLLSMFYTSYSLQGLGWAGVFFSELTVKDGLVLMYMDGPQLHMGTEREVTVTRIGQRSQN